MSRKITLLRTQRHGEFLAAQRRDPVTRKVFADGDRVTLCAACLLPFLEESWAAVGATHCGQSATAGLETFEMAAETPAGEDGADSATDSAGKGNTVRQGAVAAALNVELMPLPVKLRKIPVKLR
jgi:hypothetical protein